MEKRCGQAPYSFPNSQRDPGGLRLLETGCAVAAALESGELETARWASYQKLLAEARYYERTVDPRAAAESKRKWKAIHKSLRHHPKYMR